MGAANIAAVRNIVVKSVADAINKTTEEVAAQADASFSDDLGMTSVQIFPIISDLEDQLDADIDFASFLAQATSVNKTVDFVAGLLGVEDSEPAEEAEAGSDEAEAPAEAASCSACGCAETAEGKKIYRGEPYEDVRCAENCHAVTLDNGVDLPYVEFGEENEEVIVSGAAYFITFNTFLKDLAKKYHVYGFIMRSGHTDEGVPAEIYDEDGDIHWTRQWGKDIYEATQKLGLTKFNYVGKCHGVMPGYWLLRNHPETLLSLVSISQSMHAVPADSDNWNRLQREEGANFSLRTMRKKEGLALKAKEVATIGVNIGRQDPKDNYWGSHAEAVCDSPEEVQQLLLNNKVPMFYMFATDDILYNDFHTANVWAMENTANSRSVILQGERHLFEMDIPHKMAWETLAFLDWVKLADE